jgi:hypothetical protein
VVVIHDDNGDKDGFCCGVKKYMGNYHPIQINQSLVINK